MKQNPKKQAGFTIMELLVVVAIMASILTLATVDLAGQRAKRNLRISLSGLTSSIRKAQSYTFAGRNLEVTSQPVQYYIVKLDAASSQSGYTFQAMYKDPAGNWQGKEIETVKFPSGIKFAASNPFTITRPVNPLQQTPNCALVVFKLPFGKVLFSPGCSADPWSGSDYENLINFITNVDLDVDLNGNPVSADSNMVIKLTDDAGTMSGTITINGTTGLITSP